MSDVTDASNAMQAFVRGSEESVQDALNLIDQDYALADGSGEVLMQLVGVVDDPFAV